MSEPTGRPLASQRLALSADIDEIQRAISGITRSAHHHVMDRAGETVGEVAGLRLGGFGLASVTYDRLTTVVAEPLADRLVAIVPLAPMRVEVGDLRWQSTAPFLLSSATPTHFELPAGGGGIAVSFDPAMLAEQLGELGLRAGTGRVALSAEATGRPMTGSRAFGSLVLEACRVIDEGDDGAVTDPLIRTSLAAILTSAVVVGLRDSFERPAAPLAARRYFHDAVSVVEERYAEPLTLSAVAEAVCLSQRHLHSVFVEYAGISAARFLRQYRLKKARELLTDPERASGLTIASVARRVGLGHPGRFAAAYAAQFGEQPSDTLATTLSAGRVLPKGSAGPLLP